jgi:hypothetical protein
MFQMKQTAKFMLFIIKSILIHQLKNKKMNAR